MLVISLLNLFGCYSYESLSVYNYKEVKGESNSSKIFVKTKTAKEYYFIESSFNAENDTLFGNEYTKTISIGGAIPFREIAHIQFDYFNSNNPTLISVSEFQKMVAESGELNKIYLTKVDSTRYYFMKGNYYLANNILYGKGKQVLGAWEQRIALSDIQSIQIEYLDGVKTALLTVGIIVVTGFIIGLVKISKEGILGNK